MDPEARRFMWSVVEKISQKRKKSAVILTTHSMEEAEALSTKMGIMVSGGIFRCFGSSQHIKNKYGTGYEIEVKIKKPTQEQLEQLAETYGFSRQDQLNDMVPLDQAKNNLATNNFPDILIEQIKKNGLGNDLALEAEENKGSLRSINLMTWVWVQLFGVKVLESLCRSFGQLDLLEQYSDYFKFRVDRGDKTIGSVFGMIED